MKRALTLFLTIALAISLFAGFGTAGAEEEYLETIKQTLLLEKPSLSSKFICSIPKGIKLKVLERSEKYIRVVYDGKKGYIAIKALAEPKPLKLSKADTAANDQEKANTDTLEDSLSEALPEDLSEAETPEGRIQVMDPRGENAIVTTKEFFRYRTKKDGTAIIGGIESDLRNSGIETVIIPKYVDGYRVTGIEGWNNNSSQFSVKKLVIPEWIETIGNFSFQWCDKLETIEIYNPNLTMEGNPFYHCRKLKEISFPNGHPYLEYRDGALLDWSTERLICYSMTNTQTEYTVPAGIKVIESYAFSYNDSLESLVISEGVTTLNDSAIGVCKNLQKVDLPESMKSIGSYMFDFCYHLKGELYLSPNISHIGSNLFTGEATRLVVKDSYAEQFMKEQKRSYAYAKTDNGVRTAVATPSPEPKQSGINITKIFTMTGKMKAIINERDAKGEFVGYLVWRRNSEHAELIQSREEAGDYVMIKEVERPKEHYIWQYDLKSVQWGMTRDQIIATVGDEPILDSLIMVYFSNLYGYSCSVAFDFRDNETLKYGLFDIDPKPGQSLEDLSREIQREVEKKLHAKGKKDKEGRLVIRGKKTGAWIEPSKNGKSICLHFLAQ